MDGVGGISQPLVPHGGHFVYRFVADQPGTFIYHTHDDEAMLDSGLYGAIIVEPAHPRPVERGLAHDFLEIDLVVADPKRRRKPVHDQRQGVSGHARRSTCARGERFRIRWINISGENFHTMHTHGHYQQIIARDAAPVDVPRRRGHRAARPGAARRRRRQGRREARHVADSLPRARPHRRREGMPDGLITAIHYAGTPNTLASMYRAMMPAADAPHAKPLSFGMTVLLGAIAGFTIFLGLPIARARRRLAADGRAAQRARDRHLALSRRRDRAERDPRRSRKA